MVEVYNRNVKLVLYYFLMIPHVVWLVYQCNKSSTKLNLYTVLSPHVHVHERANDSVTMFTCLKHED